MIAATLHEQIAATEIRLRPDYRAARPRLLCGSNDREALRQKARRRPELWEAVLRAGRSATAENVPSAADIEAGRYYWRIERVQSAALAAWLLDDERLAGGATAWMVAHTRVPVWGNAFRPNRDLQAAWNLYHIAVGYDLLHERLNAEERETIRRGLVEHARAIAEGLREHEDAISYDQNHTYIPAVALTAAALTLLGEEPEADAWLRLTLALMHRCRYALGEDGYYYEGTGYWSYALHWHVRWAELMEHATGGAWMDVPVLAENWRYALLMTLPGPPHVFDLGDSALWKDATRPTQRLSNATMLWAVAKDRHCPLSQCAGDLLQARFPERDYPAATFLWLDDALAPAALETIAPRHHFRDHDVVAWRSGWGEGDTACLFRCGPPQGHAATAKLRQMRDWRMNSGHVHPDIGAFWMYARGVYLAVDTGYLAEKRTENHNTLLIGGQGQGQDGSYWNDRGIPYERFDRARVLQTRLEDGYGFALGEFSSVYPEELGLKSLRRAGVMSRDRLIVLDEMEAAPPQTLTWICQSDVPFERIGPGTFVARHPTAALAVLALGPSKMEGGSRRTVIQAGDAPNRGHPLETIHHLRLEAQPAPTHHLVTVLAAIGPNDPPPTGRLLGWRDDRAVIELSRPGLPPERVDVNLTTGEIQQAAVTANRP